MRSVTVKSTCWFVFFWGWGGHHLFDWVITSCMMSDLKVYLFYFVFEEDIGPHSCHFPHFVGWLCLFRNWLSSSFQLAKTVSPLVALVWQSLNIADIIVTSTLVLSTMTCVCGCALGGMQLWTWLERNTPGNKNICTMTTLQHTKKKKTQPRYDWKTNPIPTDRLMSKKSCASVFIL